MRIIDEKGKFLGLINIVDLLVLAAVLLVIVGAAYKIKGQDSAQNAPKTVKVTVITPAIRPEMLTNVKVGDKLVAGSSFTNVVVKDFTIQPAFMVNPDSNGQRVEAIDPYLKDVILPSRRYIRAPSTGRGISGATRYYSNFLTSSNDHGSVRITSI
jgi:hypothetical protein